MVSRYYIQHPRRAQRVVLEQHMPDGDDSAEVIDLVTYRTGLQDAYGLPCWKTGNILPFALFEIEHGDMSALADLLDDLPAGDMKPPSRRKKRKPRSGPATTRKHRLF